MVWELEASDRQLPNDSITNKPYFYFLLSAFFAGLSLNVYLAARALPIFYGIWILYLAITDWSTFRRKIWGILWFTAVLKKVTIPKIQ